MSGHSKWATTKRRKGAQDEKRSKLWAKLLRAIEVSAREGGPNVEANMTLASAVQKARDYSVPNDNIDRAIKRGAGETGGARYDEITYEGFGPGGVAFYVETLTDNRNRTYSDVRHTFTRLGGNLGDPGSVAWMFDRRGLIVIDKATYPDEERLLEIVMEAGADDLRDSGDQWELVTEADALPDVRRALGENGVPFESAELAMLPQTSVPLDRDKGEKVIRLVEALEDLEDVQNVWSNFDIPDEVLAEAG
jgi:YebC/PmpR family DNA-binding regulatory protein